MSNMSYCRFQNTLIDLQQCLNVLREPEEVKELSREEKIAAKKMLQVILEEFNELHILDCITQDMNMAVELLFDPSREEDDDAE